jgi:hypothetical protein
MISNKKNGSMKFGGGRVRRMKEGVNTLAIKLKTGRLLLFVKLAVIICFYMLAVI